MEEKNVNVSAQEEVNGLVENATVALNDFLSLTHANTNE